MAVDLATLLALEPGKTDALEWFVGSCLFEGGVWDSPRISDGIHSIDQVFERGADALRVRGRVWEIVDQTLHTFWLETKRDGTGDRFAWIVYFDVAETSARRVETVLNSHHKAEEIEWRATLAGEATVQDSKLVIIPDSTRALIRDMPEAKPLRDDGRRRSHRRGR